MYKRPLLSLAGWCRLSSVHVRRAQGRPIHLWDALSGELRGSYRAYNAVDEVTAAHCCGFSSDGARIFAGYNKMLRIFDVGCPGRAYTEIVTHRRDAPGLQGAPAVHPAAPFHCLTHCSCLLKHALTCEQYAWEAYREEASLSLE